MGKRGPQPGAVAKAAKQAKVAQPTTLKAQGATTKRTPTGAFDPAAGKETYEVEDVVGEIRKAGERRDKISGEVEGLGVDLDNTWEPIEVHTPP